MKLEAGDMIVCARDYGIVLKVKDPYATISWFEKGNDHGRFSTQEYLIDILVSTIDGDHNMLVKGNR